MPTDQSETQGPVLAPKGRPKATKLRTWTTRPNAPDSRPMVVVLDARPAQQSAALFAASDTKLVLAGRADPERRQEVGSLPVVPILPRPSGRIDALNPLGHPCPPQQPPEPAHCRCLATASVGPEDFPVNAIRASRG